MKYDPEKHHRRSIRLKGYDYSQPGGYFVTIVTQNRECLFGNVVDGKMVLNTFGRIIEYHWQRLPRHFNHITLDIFQIMPDHLHGIIFIVENARDNAGAMHSGKNNPMKRDDIPGNASPPRHSGKNNPMKRDDIPGNALPQRPERFHPRGTKPGSLAAIMQNFQSVTTRKINRIRRTPGVKLWQRNYWEHIIRGDDDLNRIREYIINNPLKWGSNDTGERPQRSIKPNLFRRKRSCQT